MPLVIAKAVKEKKHPQAHRLAKMGSPGGSDRGRQAPMALRGFLLLCALAAMHGICCDGLAPLYYAGFNTQDRHIVILERHRPLDAKARTGQRPGGSLPGSIVVPASGVEGCGTGDLF